MNISSGPANIILADSQALIIEGLKAVLKNHFTIPEIATSAAGIKEAIIRCKPDLLIMDPVQMDFNSPRELHELVANNPGLKIIILTHSITRKEITELTESGIKHIITKWADTDELMECIEAALKGKKYYSQQVLDLVMEPEKKAEAQSTSGLTASEIEIVRLLSQGLTNKDIAQKKFLSVHTIMTHRKNIMKKLGTSNVSEMIMHAIRSGLIDNIEYHI